MWHNYGFDRHVLFNHNVDCLVRLFWWHCFIYVYVYIYMDGRSCVYVCVLIWVDGRACTCAHPHPHPHKTLTPPMKGFAGDTMHMARLWDSSRAAANAHAAAGKASGDNGWVFLWS